MTSGLLPLEPAAMRSFWIWFRGIAASLRPLTADDDPILAALTEKLATLHPDLTFELGPADDETREFVISAGGAREAFPAVTALAAAAPDLPRWRVVSFRPRRVSPARIAVEGLSLSPADVRFELRPEPGGTGIVLYIPGYERNDHARYVAAAFALLDTALGEVDVETKLGSVELRVLAEGSGEKAASFLRLPATIDDLPAATPTTGL
jgi:hypothetical protein